MNYLVVQRETAEHDRYLGQVLMEKRDIYQQPHGAQSKQQTYIKNKQEKTSI